MRPPLATIRRLILLLSALCCLGGVVAYNRLLTPNLLHMSTASTSGQQRRTSPTVIQHASGGGGRGTTTTAVKLPGSHVHSVPHRSLISQSNQGGVALGSWRKALSFQSFKKNNPSMPMGGSVYAGIEETPFRIGREVVRSLAQRLLVLSERFEMVSSACERLASIMSFIWLRTLDNLWEPVLDHLGYPLMNIAIEPMVIEPLGGMRRAMKRLFRKGKKMALVVGTAVAMGLGGRVSGVSARGGGGGRSTITRPTSLPPQEATPSAAIVRTHKQPVAAVTQEQKGPSGRRLRKKKNVVVKKVQVKAQDGSIITKLKGVVVDHPGRTAGVAVVAGGAALAYKKKKEKDEMWSHLDDDWYYQEDDIPKAKQLAKAGQLGDIKVQDIDKAVKEGRAGTKGSKKDQKFRKAIKSDQVISKEYKEEKRSLFNLFQKSKPTRMISEEQIMWAGLDGDRKDGPFLVASARALSTISPVKLKMVEAGSEGPLAEEAAAKAAKAKARAERETEKLLQLQVKADEENDAEATAAAVLDAAATATDAVVLEPTPTTPTSDTIIEGETILDQTQREADEATNAAAAGAEGTGEESDAAVVTPPPAAPTPVKAEPGPWDELLAIRDRVGLSETEAAESFANAVNVAVVKIVDEIVPTLKGAEAQTLNACEGLLNFMEKAGELFAKVAPGVTEIRPVIYQGTTPPRKLEMIYTRYCQFALVEDLEHGNDKAVKVQELFDISNKKADKISSKILTSQDNLMKILEKQFEGEGMEELNKMLESFKDGGAGDFGSLGNMFGAGGVPGGPPQAKEMAETLYALKETLDALKAVVQQGGLSDQDMEELRDACKAQGVDLEDLIRHMEGLSSDMNPESQELTRMFKQALKRT